MRQFLPASARNVEYTVLSRALQTIAAAPDPGTGLVIAAGLVRRII
jgi:hypothetical protein